MAELDTDGLAEGTAEEHLDTIRRAIANKVDSIWTGDLARNRYLQETLRFAEKNGLVTITERTNYENQESFWDVTWHPELMPEQPREEALPSRPAFGL